jgi:hypothetical protein
MGTTPERFAFHILANNPHHMTTPKKGLYYYFVRGAAILGLPAALVGLLGLKGLYINDALMSDYVLTVKSMFMIVFELYLIHEIFNHGSGYTIVSTTEYKLFRCRESGKDETFMMFADNMEELEKYFEYIHPHKIVFIEDAEMTGKSVEMKIFNQEYENRRNNS